MSLSRMTCRVTIAVALFGCGTPRRAVPPPPPPSASPAQHAAELERKAKAELQNDDSASVARASELFAEAGKQWDIAGNDSASAAAFEQAGASARLAGNREQAFRYYGTAVQTRDSLARVRIRTALNSWPDLRDADAEASFVGQARALLVKLGVLDAADATRSIRSTVDAYAALEELAAGSNEIPVTIRSNVRSMEVRVRRWISQYGNAPWTTVRTDTTLLRAAMHYEFCYLDPSTGKPMVIDQECADGCTLILPSGYATSSNCSREP